MGNLLFTPEARFIWNAYFLGPQEHPNGRGLLLSDHMPLVRSLSKKDVISLLSFFYLFLNALFSGWSIDSEEREWKYRLSIYYIKSQDTGIYTCSTPKGLTHSIVLNVIEVHCKVSEILTNDPNLLIHTQGSRLGQSTTYKCREGFKLNGTSMSICQASGK